LGADDFIFRDFFRTSLNALKEVPHIPLCCSDNGYINEHHDPKKILSDKSLKSADGTTTLTPQKVHESIYSNRLYIPGHTVILKKESLIHYGGYQSKLANLADWYINYAIALNHGILYVPETLSVWRIHSRSYSSQCAADQKCLKEIYLQVLLELKNKPFKRLFVKSVVFESFLKANFWPLLFSSPSHIDFLFHYALKKWKKRIKKWKRFL
jgi:hypothetical protein